MRKKCDNLLNQVIAYTPNQGFINTLDRLQMWTQGNGVTIIHFKIVMM